MENPLLLLVIIPLLVFLAKSRCVPQHSGTALIFSFSLHIAAGKGYFP